MSKKNDIAKHVSSLLKAIADKIEENPEILEKMGLDLFEMPGRVNEGNSSLQQTGIDIFSIFSKEGAHKLRENLGILDLGTLKRILKEHDFDPSNFAEKWDDKDRVIDLIVRRVGSQTDRMKPFK